MAKQDPTSAEKYDGTKLSELASQRSSNIVSELWSFVRSNRKWWLLPILSSLLLIGFFLILATTGAAPLIYTLF